MFVLVVLSGKREGVREVKGEEGTCTCIYEGVACVMYGGDSEGEGGGCG